MATTEVKVWGAVVGSAAAGFGVSILNAVQDNPELLGGTPVFVQGLVLTLVPALITWLGGFIKKSRTSRVSEAFVPGNTQFKDAA